MPSKKLAERKKNKKQIEKRQDALRRRQAALTDRTRKQIDFKVQEMMKAKQRPIRNENNPDDVTFTKELSADQIRERLNHNLEILKALEEEYDLEMAARQERNQDLENSGHESLKEKMDALHGQAVEVQQNDDGLAFGGEAEVVFEANQE